MTKITVVSIAVNVILLSIIGVSYSNHTKNKAIQENALFKLRHEMNQTVGYTTNLVERIERISQIADSSVHNVRVEYDKVPDGKISSQLSLDSIFLIKEWIDRAKQESKDWPRRHNDEIAQAFIIFENAPN